MPEDWKGEAIIRNVPRDTSRLSLAQERKKAAAARDHTRVCAGDPCSVMLSKSSPFNLCQHCRMKRRKKHA